MGDEATLWAEGKRHFSFNCEKKARRPGALKGISFSIAYAMEGKGNAGGPAQRFGKKKGGLDHLA